MREREHGWRQSVEISLLAEMFSQPRLDRDVSLAGRAERSELHERVPYLVKRKRRRDMNRRPVEHHGWTAEQIAAELDTLQASLGRPRDEVKPRGVLVDNPELESEATRTASEDERTSG